MCWDEKAPVNAILLFCRDWRTREEIQNKFKLTKIESWHAMRFIGKLTSDVITQRGIGETSRLLKIRSRNHVIEEIESSISIPA